MYASIYICYMLGWKQPPRLAYIQGKTLCIYSNVRSQGSLRVILKVCLPHYFYF